MKTACVIETKENFLALQSQPELAMNDIVVYCTCPETGEFLREKGIAHISLSEDLFKEEWDDINAWAKKASLNWFKELPFSEALQVEGLNVADVYNRPISHALICALKNQWFADYLLNKESITQFIVFENLKEIGADSALEGGSINAILANRKPSLVQLKIPCYSSLPPLSRIKEWIRAMIGLVLGMAIGSKRNEEGLLYGMGNLQHLLPVLSRKKSVFVDVSFQYAGFRTCREKGIAYLLGTSLISPREQAELAKETRSFTNRLRQLQAQINHSSWFIYKNTRLENIAETLSLIMTEGLKARLSQNFIVRKIQERRGQALILHEDVDAFRAAAMAAKKYRLACVVLSHGIPPTRGDWSQIAAGVQIADLIVGSEFEKDKYIQTGYDAESIHVLGLPRFDRIYREVQKSKPKALAGKTVLYCPHMLTRVTKQKKGYLAIHTPGSVTRFNSIEVLKACAALDCTLIIKPHGNSQDIDLWQDLVAKHGNARTKLVPHKADIFQLLQDCDVVVATFSTVVIEAALFNRNAITINFTGKPDLHPYAQKGIAAAVYEPDQLRQALYDSLFDETKINEMKRLRQLEREYFGGPFDGKNTERVIGYLNSLRTEQTEENRKSQEIAV